MKRAFRKLIVFSLILAQLFIVLNVHTLSESDWLSPQNTPPLPDYDYSFAVIPDTQTLTRYLPEQTSIITEYIKNNAESQKIKLAIHLGDMTDQNAPAQWSNIKTAMNKLNGIMPYFIVPGNHDYDRTKDYRDLTNFNATFPVSEFSSQPSWGGAFESNSMANTYHKMVIEGVPYLFMMLEFAPRNEVVSWASNIIQSNPDYNVIIVTHAYLNNQNVLYHKSAWTGSSYRFATTGGNYNDGFDLWENLISNHENISMVLCGHSSTENVLLNNALGIQGNPVRVLMADGQEMDLESYNDGGPGYGMVMMLYFSEGGSKVDVRYYSPIKEMFLKTSNQFSIRLNVVKEAGGPTYPPIVITEIFPNPAGSDIHDFMEIMNVSPAPLDLYNYAMWGRQESSADNFSIETVFRYNFLAENPGEYILNPGQFAILIPITNVHYQNGTYAYLNESGEVVYNIAGIISKIQSDYGTDAIDLSNAIIVPVDRTLKDASGTLNATGTGLANSSYSRYWITERTDTVNRAICYADVPVANVDNIDYNYVKSSDGSKQMTQYSTGSSPTYGFLAPGQIVEMNPRVLTSPLVITEIFPNPAGSDIHDFMEILNISSETIDLYDYMMWGRQEASVDKFDLSKVFRHNYLAQNPGEYLLSPGQFAIIIPVTTVHYTNGYAAPDGQGGATYDLDGIINKIRTDFGEDAIDLSNAIVVLVDRTLKDAAGTLNSNGTGLANSSYSRYWLTNRGETVYDALCWADVPVATTENIDYNYIMPLEDVKQMAQLSVGYTPTYGFLAPGQSFPLAFIPEPAEAFEYEGFSIRVDAPHGLRVKYKIRSNVLDAAYQTSGYRLVEYGALLTQRERFDSSRGFAMAELVLDENFEALDNTSKVLIWKDGQYYGNIYSVDSSGMSYTAVLVDIKPENLAKKYAFRAYCILQSVLGDYHVIYSDAQDKSIYEIALQVLADANNGLSESEIAFIEQHIISVVAASS